MDSFLDNLNKISDVSEGFFLSVLDFPSSRSLPYFLDRSYRYVWVIKHFIHDPRSFEKRDKEPWFNVNLPLSAVGELENVKVRDMEVCFDFIVSTEQFMEILKDESFHKSAGIRCVQMNNLPPDYFCFDKIAKGKGLFRELRKIDTNFFATFNKMDYGVIFHSRKDVLESFLNDPDIDLANLP